MKLIKYLLLYLLAVFQPEVFGQTVKGKLIDHYGDPLMGVNVILYIYPNAYRTLTNEDGTFTLLNVVKNEPSGNLPVGYYVSECYPNPFNPKTRIVYQVPEPGIAKINVFNSLGQSVIEQIEKTIKAGINYTDLELNGLPNGIYFANIILNGKYSVTKKLSLVYGSPHLSSSALPRITVPGNRLNKMHTSTAQADSLVVFNDIMGKKVFTNLPNISSQITEFGDLTVERYWPGLPTVTYAGKIYNTVKIGSQCWLRENLDVGIMIPGSREQTNNGVIEKYSYNNDSNYCKILGGLYSWNEAMAYSTVPGSRGICPPGFHIPTATEFEELIATVNNSGNSLKDKGQGIFSGIGSNISGYSGLLAGYRFIDGNYWNYTANAMFWSSTLDESSNAYSIFLFMSTDNIAINSKLLNYGYSIRCIKDE